MEAPPKHLSGISKFPTQLKHSFQSLLTFLLSVFVVADLDYSDVTIWSKLPELLTSWLRLSNTLFQQQTPFLASIATTIQRNSSSIMRLAKPPPRTSLSAMIANSSPSLLAMASSLSITWRTWSYNAPTPHHCNCSNGRPLRHRLKTSESPL